MNVHAEDEELNEKMELAGKRLGLCGHVTGTRQKKVIYGPGDIEGHRGHVSEMDDIITNSHRMEDCTS